MNKCTTLICALLSTSFTVFAQDTCPLDVIAIPDAQDSWQWVSGSYADGGSVTYELPLLQGNSISYVFKTGCGNGASTDHNTVIEYRTPPPCILVMSDSGSCSQGGAELNLNFVVYEGPSRIRVRGANGAGGSFTLAYRSIGGSPGNCNECPSHDETLEPGSYWQTIDGDYESNGCKVYLLQATAGLTYEFKTGCGDGATADHDTRIGILNSYCYDVAQDGNGCGSGRSSITWAAPSSGTFFIRVSGASGEDGAFTMAYRRLGGNGSACGSCTGYDANLSSHWEWWAATGSYLPGGCQVYRLIQNAGYEYTYKTGCGDGAESDRDARLELFDDPCNLLMSGTDTCGDGSSTIRFLSSGQQPLYLRVSGSSGAGGTYSLATRRTGPCPTCPDHDQEISPSEQWDTLNDEFLEYGCRVYRLNLTEGAAYHIQLQCTDCSPWGSPGPTMQFFDLSCSPVQFHTFHPEWPINAVSFVAEYSGPMYLRVYGIDWRPQGFTLSYKRLGPAADACLDAPVVPIPPDGFVELEGRLVDITSNDDQLSGTPWEGSAVAWYAVEIPEDCHTFMVSYCQQGPAWPGSMGIVSTGCAGDPLIHGTPSVHPLCSNGSANDEYELPPGTYYLPIPSDPENDAYHIIVGCSHIIEGGIIPAPGSPRWAVHPNPGNNELSVTGHVPGSDPVTALVVDMTGRVVQHTLIVPGITRIDASSWRQGTYFIRVVGGGTEHALLRWVKE